MLACMVSCQKDFSTLRLEIESYNGEKLHLNGANYSCWDNGDELSINGRIHAISLDASAHSATIALDATESGAEDFYAIYPASVWNRWVSGQLNINWPTTQTYCTNSNGQVLEAPMFAYCENSSGESLKFKNLGALLAVTVAADNGSPVTVKSITVRSNEGAYLSGAGSMSFGSDTAAVIEDKNYVTLDCGDGVTVNSSATKTFYIAIPPVTCKSVKIEVNTGSTIYYREKSVSTSPYIKFNRNTIYNIPFAMNGAQTLSNDVKYIYYTTTDGEVAELIDYTPEGWDMSTNGRIGIPATCTTIPDGVFGSIFNLKTVTLPEGITEIGYSAFAYCESLTKIDLPSTLTKIDDGAFAGCYSLTTVNCYATKAPALEEAAFEDDASSAELHVPVGANYSSWSGYFQTITDDLR